MGEVEILTSIASKTIPQIIYLLWGYFLSVLTCVRSRKVWHPRGCVWSCEEQRHSFVGVSQIDQCSPLPGYFCTEFLSFLAVMRSYWQCLVVGKPGIQFQGATRW